MANPNMIMMGLGSFRFGIDTASYQTFSRETDFGWRSQPRAANLPHYQNVTLGADAIEFKGVIYPTFRGGVKQIDAMRAMGRLRTPLALVSGRGRWFGNWVIMKVAESSSIFFSNGAPRKMEFTINIEYIGEGGDR